MRGPVLSTFDASSQGAHSADPSLLGYNDPPGAVHSPEQDMPLLSTLDELRAVAAEEDTRAPITVTNPRETIRLTLRTDLEQREIRQWSNRSLDRKDREKLKRRGGSPNLTNLDPVVMFASAIAETCIQVEVLSRSSNTWQVVTDERTGEPLTFGDATLRQVLGGLDAVSAVKRAFNGSEPALMNAGNRLIDASGFGDEVDEDDEEDPTTAAG